MAGPLGGAEFSFPLSLDPVRPSFFGVSTPLSVSTPSLILESTGSFSLADFIQELLSARTNSPGRSVDGIGTSPITITIRGLGGDTAQFSLDSLLASLPFPGDPPLVPEAGGSAGSTFDFFA